MSKKEKYTVTDLISDHSFINWVIDGKASESQVWADYLVSHPDQQANFEQAASFIRSVWAEEPAIEPERILLMWQKIHLKLARKRRVLVLRRWMTAAAAIVVLAVSAYTFQKQQKASFIPFEEGIIAANESIQLLTGDGHVKDIDGESLVIRQQSDGTLLADADTISIEQPSSEIKMNQLTVPYGKRTDLYLSDGTHIYVNSGSKLAFPSVFKGKQREIFLSGEAYCEVVADKQHPFIIHTDDIDVRVTGTAFNIQAYANEEHMQTVLVHGEVTLVNRGGILKDKLIMKPGESAVFDKASGNYSVKNVETEQYTSWINGYLILEHRPVSAIFRSLERYYNTSIHYHNKAEAISFSGKLDLRDSIVDVLGTIGFASELEVTAGDNTYEIQRKTEE